MVSTQKKAFFDYPLPIAFAHRGGDERFPENTLAAFADAYQLGYRYFETDVHYTVDHELVAFHDSDLKRTLGLNGTIKTMTKHDRKTKLLEGKYPVPLLEDLLKAFPTAYFNIDAKSSAAVRPLIELIQRYDAVDRVCLASFSGRTIKRMRELLPGIPTISTRYEAASLRLGSALNRLSSASTRYLEISEHLFHDARRIKILNDKFIANLHAHNHKVFIWTVNEPAEMHRLLDLGVDGIFTDKLRLLKEVLIERGQWKDV